MKAVVWSGVIAAVLIAFGAVTYIAAQPVAVLAERATWYLGLTSRYRPVPTYFIMISSWMLVTLLSIALVRWLGRRSSQDTYIHMTPYCHASHDILPQRRVQVASEIYAPLFTQNP
jgi:hypothetical protein